MKSYISYYTFFDTNLVFKTNSTIANREFQKIYAYFKSPSSPSGKAIACSLVKNDNCYRVDIKSPRYCICYTQSGEISPDAYLAMFSPVIYEVKDYFLIHAGTLSARKKYGLIISAPCGFGKTTLTRELLKEGFRFLSDELAPVKRNTGMIYPYPGGMGVLEEGEKKIIPQEGETGDPCKPSCVVFLRLSEAGEAENDTRYMELALARMDRNVCRQLRELPEVKEIAVVLDRLVPMLRLSVTKGARIVPRIQEICDRNEVPIMYTYRGKTTPPDFGAKPELREISQKDGIFELSGNVLNANRSALLEEVFKGSQTAMIFELTRLMNQTRFYRLTVGRLSEMAALVRNLCREL